MIIVPCLILDHAGDKNLVAQKISYLEIELVMTRAVFAVIFIVLLPNCAAVKTARPPVAPSLVVQEDNFEKLVYRRFVMPKENQQNVIYVLTAMNEGNGTSPYEMTEAVKTDIALLAHTQLADERQLFDLLLNVETKLRRMMTKNANFMRAVIYVGQSKSLLDRATQHRRDIMDQRLTYQSSKVRWLQATIKKHFIKMDYVVKNIPSEHLDIFECLVGHLFSVLDFKGSSRLGNAKAFAEFARYLKSSKRIDVLSKAGLLDSMEKDRERLRESILPFLSPWTFYWRELWISPISA